MSLKVFQKAMKKIGLKLILVVGVTAAIIIGIYAYINIQSQHEVLLAEVERHGNQLSETIKNSIHYEMLNYHRNRIIEIISTIAEEPSIIEVSVNNKEGIIIYSTTQSDINTKVEQSAESCYACHEHDEPLEDLPLSQRTRIYSLPGDTLRVLGIINPIYNESSCWQAGCHAHNPDQKVLGVLNVTMCLKEVDKQLNKSKVMAGSFALIAILAISILIGFFVKRWVDKPVNSLLEATKQVASGNLKYTINNLGEDELGMLARSFNHMTLKMNEARQQLFHSDKMASLGRLAAGVAHEINNPLTGILTYSSFLQKHVKDSPEIQKDLKVIVRETLRSREIVKGLLDFARQSIPKKKRANLNEIISQALVVVKNQLKMKQIEVETDLDDQLCDLTVDANQIQQVFINLMVNAADAMEANGGSIKISTTMLNLSPYGHQHIKQATCPKSHSLIDDKFKIGGISSLKVRATSDGQEGMIYLDPIYGHYNNRYIPDQLDDTNVEISCPDCNVSLMHEFNKCPRCGSAVYVINIPAKGTLEGCVHASCKWQKWEFIDSTGSSLYVQAEIEDSGCGINENELDKIFEPFYTTKGQKGTGLGLAIIWGIIDNHEGVISVKSNPGKGTVFTLQLPVENSV
jgi:two-component system NtrC family sensor kinase